MRTSWRATGGRGQHWWQARPITGLLAGWIAIALIAWRVWSAFSHSA